MKRSKHSLSHTRLTSLNMGQLYPVACVEVLPGDSFRHQTACLVRVAPLAAPVMHPVHLMVHHWYVPSRLLWSNWEDFITGKNPALTLPTVTVNMSQNNNNPAGLARAFAVGADSQAAMVLNALPFRAYNLIYNEFYRDQDLTSPLIENTGNGPDSATDYFLRAPSWEKDYFTTCRPQPQQGAGTESIAVNIAGSLPVTGIGVNASSTYPSGGTSVRESDGATRTYTAAVQGGSAAPNNVFVEGVSSFPNIRAVGSGLTASMDINQWRTSMAMQRMREHRNRYGSRYRDLLAFLGVNSSDARLQRPEYLGGGKQTIAFSEVLSTAEVPSGSTVGEMAGHGIAAMRTRPYKRFFEEHGYMISLLVARPRTVYPTRVPRHFYRRDYEQFWQKELEIMGDQSISNGEVYGDAPSPATVFGYQNRYDEYRHEESSVSGEFRTILDYWHMGRKFASQPALNAAFVACDPTTRIYQAQSNDQLYAMVAHRISARRLVSKFPRA